MSDTLKALDDLGELLDQLASNAREFDYNTANRMERDAAKALLAIEAAVNALPELLAIKAERDRAQRACEQMGQRITELENSLREIGAAIINGASDTLWMGDQISDETVVDFICNLTGDDPSLLGTFARAALNQEPGQ